MADEPKRKQVTTGVRQGGGPPPGYAWNVDLLRQATDEARDLLNEEQYGYLSRRVRELARHDDPTHSTTLDIRPIGEFFELREKGGVLNKINARVFFFLHKPARTIMILGVINKKNDGPTPLGDRRRMEWRKRDYERQIPG